MDLYKSLNELSFSQNKEDIGQINRLGYNYSLEWKLSPYSQLTSNLTNIHTKHEMHRSFVKRILTVFIGE